MTVNFECSTIVKAVVTSQHIKKITTAQTQICSVRDNKGQFYFKWTSIVFTFSKIYFFVYFQKVNEGSSDSDGTIILSPAPAAVEDTSVPELRRTDSVIVRLFVKDHFIFTLLLEKKKLFIITLKRTRKLNSSIYSKLK